MGNGFCDGTVMRYADSPRAQMVFNSGQYHIHVIRQETSFSFKKFMYFIDWRINSVCMAFSANTLGRYCLVAQLDAARALRQWASEKELMMPVIGRIREVGGHRRRNARTHGEELASGFLAEHFEQ
jgi:hypothetical protein